jgi:NTP pyrophosphatase (non-canonical NTP hydrolase)
MLAKVISDVRAERERQDEKWGEQNHMPDRWMCILMEEVGEAAKEILEAQATILVPRGRKKFREEMVQVAAVALAIIECVDRQLARVHTCDAPSCPLCAMDRELAEQEASK